MLNREEWTEKNGMDWVTSSLKTLSESLNVHVEQYSWEAFDLQASDKSYCLIVLGSNKRKIVKLFSGWELTNCCTDKNLQDELNSRLIKLLNFLQGTVGRARSRP